MKIPNNYKIEYNSALKCYRVVWVSLDKFGMPQFKKKCGVTETFDSYAEAVTGRDEFWKERTLDAELSNWVDVDREQIDGKGEADE